MQCTGCHFKKIPLASRYHLTRKNLPSSPSPLVQIWLQKSNLWRQPYAKSHGLIIVDHKQIHNLTTPMAYIQYSPWHYNQPCPFHAELSSFPPVGSSSHISSLCETPALMLPVSHCDFLDIPAVFVESSSLQGLVSADCEFWLSRCNKRDWSKLNQIHFMDDF